MRLPTLLLFLLLGLRPGWGQSPSDTNAAPRALPADATTASGDVVAPVAVPGGVNVHWYGHGFIYLTSSVGIRAAIDPFGPDTVHYKFPQHLSADFVLVSHETEDHSAAELIFGNPLIFRSVMAVGLQRANGIPFYGIGMQKDANGLNGANTAFDLTFDGIKFCYLGRVAAPLLAQEKVQLGHVDVLFLPIGSVVLSVGELNQIVRDLEPRVIIPIEYKSELSGDVPLRNLSDYLDGTKFPVRRFNTDEIVLTHSTLPEEPTVYVLKSP